jgi:hypothetical protein
MRSVGRAVAAAAILAALAGCSGSKDKIPCPSATIAPDVSAVVKFRDGPGRDFKDMSYAGKMLAVNSSCEAADKNGVNVSNKLGITAIRRDPNLTQGQLTYFVAVADPQLNILAKRNFVIDITFPSMEREVTITEELAQHIPLPKGASASRYSVLFGFQLTAEELAYNRAHFGEEAVDKSAAEQAAPRGVPVQPVTTSPLPPPSGPKPKS